jgi:hypothetical protein
VRAVPRLCGFYPGICLTIEEKAEHSPETEIHAAGGIDPATPPSEWLQVHAVDRTSTGIGTENIQILILNAVN